MFELLSTAVLPAVLCCRNVEIVLTFVEFNSGELGVMGLVHAFVSEDL